jgi:hypothetical protein
MAAFSGSCAVWFWTYRRMPRTSRMLCHQRGVLLTPVGLEFLPGEVRQAPQTKGELDHSRSPPAAAALVPSFLKARITFLPVIHLCTSSGPSTRRWDRMGVYQAASGVSSE